MSYKTQVEINEDVNKKKENEMPKIPFIISVYNSKDLDSTYMVSKQFESNQYFLISLASGNAYGYDYTEEVVLNKIKEKIWIPKESKISIEF